MATTHATKPTRSARETVPPFRPDPDIMGNDEGNKRILKHDRDAARKFLHDQDSDQ